MTKLYIRPASPGLVVRDPETLAPLAAAGEWKPRSRYWLRRIADGSVMEATPPSKHAKPSKKAAKNED